MRRTTIHLEAEQHQQLTHIAQQQKRSLSVLIRDMIQTQLEAYHRRDLEQAAQALLDDYTSDWELTALTALDGVDIHTGAQ